jgi:cytolysin-activating lysine-acyltransferase
MTTPKHPPNTPPASGDPKGAAQGGQAAPTGKGNGANGAGSTTARNPGASAGATTGTFTKAQSGLAANLSANGAAPGVDHGMTKTVAQVLGEITWLMTQSAGHKSFFIGDLEWMVMTPILMQQFRMFYEKDKPIGVVLWAYADAETSARLAEGGTRLRPQDWKSGDHANAQAWVVDIIAPFGGGDAMVADLKSAVMPTRELRVRGLVDGKIGVRVM